LVATVGQDNTARVWEASGGQPVTPPLAHGGAVRSVAFSPDSRWVVTASQDNTARVWDAATGRPLTPPLAHGSRVESAVFSPDGQRVATASSDRTARVWDATTGRPLTPPLSHREAVRTVAFSEDGRWLATTCEDGTARLWDVSDAAGPLTDLVRLVQVLSGHRTDDTGTAVPLSGEELQRLWDDLRQKDAAEFTISPAAARAWREREIGDCLREGNLDAARFHFWWLVAEMVSTDRRPR
jgi:WD40 repeat protein